MIRKYRILGLAICLAMLVMVAYTWKNTDEPKSSAMIIAVCGTGPSEVPVDESSFEFAARRLGARRQFGLKNLSNETLWDVEIEIQTRHRDGRLENFFSGFVGKWEPGEVEDFQRPSEWEVIMVHVRVGGRSTRYRIDDLPGDLASDLEMLTPQ